MSYYETATYRVALVGLEAVESDWQGTNEFSTTYMISRQPGGGPPASLGDSVIYLASMEQELIDEIAIPKLGMLYGDWTNYYETRWSQYARARSYDWTTGENGYCKLTVRWSTMWTSDPTTQMTGPGDPPTGLYMCLPVSVEYHASSRAANIWRNGWTVPPPVAADVSLDVGGTLFSGGKEGLAVQVPQVRLRLRLVQDSFVTGMSAQYALLTPYVNTRNSDVFMDFPIGSLVCEGINMLHLQGEFYEIVVDYLYDANNHHEQVATLDPTGSVKVTGSDVSEVLWKRITMDTTAFNDIFLADADLKAIAEKGYWI